MAVPACAFSAGYTRVHTSARSLPMFGLNHLEAVACLVSRQPDRCAALRSLPMIRAQHMGPVMLAEVISTRMRVVPASVSAPVSRLRAVSFIDAWRKAELTAHHRLHSTCSINCHWLHAPVLH